MVVKSGIGSETVDVDDVWLVSGVGLSRKISKVCGGLWVWSGLGGWSLSRGG